MLLLYAVHISNDLWYHLQWLSKVTDLNLWARVAFLILVSDVRYKFVDLRVRCDFIAFHPPADTDWHAKYQIPQLILKSTPHKRK